VPLSSEAERGEAMDEEKRREKKKKQKCVPHLSPFLPPLITTAAASLFGFPDGFLNREKEKRGKKKNERNKNKTKQVIDLCG
jgi:hypothetical protein